VNRVPAAIGSMNAYNWRAGYTRSMASSVDGTEYTEIA